DPVSIPGKGSYEFKPIYFLVTLDASVGWNEYYIIIDYEDNHSDEGNGGAWASEIESIYIHDFYEKIYNENRYIIESNLMSAKGCDFESQFARSTLNQAENEFNLSRSLAEQNRWQEACSHVTISANLIEQSYSYETMYWKTKVKNVIDAAENEIEDLAELWSPAAKKSLDKARNKLDSSKIDYQMGSIFSLKRAFSFAQESISLANRTRFSEKNFRIFVKALAVGVVLVAAIFAFNLRGKP
ncbi:MAG: hypothetical protein ACE5OO_02255, partial [Candidatus Bathyarchaeia archaeon]